MRGKSMVDLSDIVETSRRQIQERTQREETGEQERKHVEDLRREQKEWEEAQRQRELEEKQKDAAYRAAEKQRLAEEVGNKKRLKEAEDEARRIRAKQEDREKAREFEEMRKRNEAKIRAEQDYKEKLKSEKSPSARIRLRQKEDERVRQENLRISAINNHIPQKTEYEKKLINAGRLKGAVSEAVSRSPGILDRAVTSIFNPIIQQSTGEVKPKQTFSKGIVQESRQFSKATASKAKKPITGGKVSAPPNLFGVVSAGDRFVDSLMGAPVQPNNPKSVQKKKAINPTSPLDDFVRRL